MRIIENIGNLPKSLQILAKSLGGTSIPLAKFYECTNAKELENLAKDLKCELTATMDPSTSRGYLVGFDVSEEPSIIDRTLSVHCLYIYFVELKAGDFTRYDNMLRQHKNDQQTDMLDRQIRKEEAIERKQNAKNK
jgi:hypothetical protein